MKTLNMFFFGVENRSQPNYNKIYTHIIYSKDIWGLHLFHQNN